MKKLFRFSSVLVLLIAIAASPLLSQSLSQEDIKRIEEATFTRADGQPVSVSDLEGKMVLLDFWETWCAPCLESFPGMQKALDQYSEHFAVLAVNSGFADSKQDMNKFIQNNDYGFIYAMDNNQVLAKKLKIRSIPFKIFIDPDGNFIQSKLGKLPNEYEHIKSLLAEHTDADIQTK